MVPNHALIILALLYGDDDFRKSLMIVNTAGWDTDCNAGNVGCLLGIKNGLAGIDAAPDWRGPVADRMYLSTADGGRAITDAVTRLTRSSISGAPSPAEPPRAEGRRPVPLRAAGSRAGVPGRPSVGDPRQCRRTESNRYAPLAVRWTDERPDNPVVATTPTFIPPEAIVMPGSYTLLASPTLYPGQEVRARLVAHPGNAGPVEARLLIRYYGDRDELQTLAGSPEALSAGAGRRARLAHS